MKKMILKLLVVTLFFQTQTNAAFAMSAAEEIQQIENFNANMTEMNQNIDIEGLEYEGEEGLTPQELKELEKESQKQLQQQDADNSTEDISASGGVAALQAKTEALTRRGTWGVHYIYISKNGKRQELTTKNIHSPLTPASTLKVFSGYLAFLNRSYANADLSYTLHVSSNPGADAALRSVTGSIPKSIALLKKTYSGLEDISKLRMFDGSGLLKANKVTARLETSLMEKIYTDGQYNVFKRLMAQPGEWSTLYNSKSRTLAEVDENTCKAANSQDVDDKRPVCLYGKGLNIYAKTGTLPRGRVKGLTGFVESDKGVIIFSMVANNVDAHAALETMKKLVKLHTGTLRASGDL